MQVKQIGQLLLLFENFQVSLNENTRNDINEKNQFQQNLFN